MPRKSVQALVTPTPPRVDGKQAALIVPSDLSESAKLIWRAIVSSLPGDHFRRSDEPLLRSYAEITAVADLAAQKITKEGAVVGGRTSPWLNVQERAIRAQATLAVRLRLCPSARTDPKTTGRQRLPAAPGIDFTRLPR